MKLGGRDLRMWTGDAQFMSVSCSVVCLRVVAGRLQKCCAVRLPATGAHCATKLYTERHLHIMHTHAVAYMRMHVCMHVCMYVCMHV